METGRFFDCSSVYWPDAGGLPLAFHTVLDVDRPVVAMLT